jgi:hypothetical protein
MKLERVVGLLLVVGCADVEAPIVEDEVRGGGKADDPARQRAAAEVAALTASCTLSRGPAWPTRRYTDHALAKVVRAPAGKLVRLAFGDIPAQEIDLWLDAAGAGARTMSVEVWPYPGYGRETHAIAAEVQLADGTIHATVRDTYLDAAPTANGGGYFLFTERRCEVSGPIVDVEGDGAPTSRFPPLAIRTPGGRCLEVPPGDGPRVADCGGAAGQRFVLADTGQVVTGDGRCLVMSSAGGRDAVAAGDCGGPTFTALGDLRVRAADTTRCLARPGPVLAGCSTHPDVSLDQTWRFTTWGSLLTHRLGADTDSCLVATAGAPALWQFSHHRFREGLCSPEQRWAYTSDRRLAQGELCLAAAGDAVSLAACGGSDQAFELVGEIAFSRPLVGGGSGTWSVTAPWDTLTVTPAAGSGWRWTFVP